MPGGAYFNYSERDQESVATLFQGMSRLAAGDPHPRTTRKPWTGFTSAAARLLLRHGRTEAANGESIEFFSALRKCLPDPHISSQTAARGAAQPADGKGKVRRGVSGGGADEVLSLSSGIGKHDYDWLLTPPGTPLWSPATSTSGHHQVSAAAPSRLAKAGSASHSKASSRLGPTGLGEEKKPATSRLSNCSSATSVNDAAVPPGRSLRVRTSSASSMNTASNASVSSTALWSGDSSSPRTPGTVRSPAPAPPAAATAQTRRRDKARLVTTTSYVVVPSMAASKPKPTCARAHSSTPGVSSPRSTATTSRQPSLARRGDDVVAARSRLARQSSGGAGSTLPPRQTGRGAPGLASSNNGVVKSRQTPAAASTTTAHKWRRSLAPAIAAARNVRNENPLDNGSPIYSVGGRKINGEETTPHRAAAAAAAMGGGLARAGSRKSGSTNDIAKRTVDVNENEDCRRRQDARHGGAGAPDPHRKPALLQETRRSAVTSRIRLGLMAAATSKSGSIAGGGHQHVAPAAAAAAVAKVAGPEAFPSTRYDAMLLREDPRNLTWLRGCDEGDDGSVGGIDLVDSSLELFDVATALRRTAVRN